MFISYNEVTQCALSGKIPWKLAEKGFRKLKYLKSSIELIERDSSLPYPEVIVTPLLKILVHESGVEAIVHGHIDFKRGREGLIIPFVNISLPFLINAKKHTYNCVLAHEFLHYLYIAQRVSKADYFTMSQKIGETMISHMLFDEATKIDPVKVFKNRYLLGLLAKRYEKLVNEEKFIKSMRENWIEANLLSKFIPETQFIKTFTISEFLKMSFPKIVLDRLSGI